MTEFTRADWELIQRIVRDPKVEEDVRTVEVYNHLARAQNVLAESEHEAYEEDKRRTAAAERAALLAETPLVIDPATGLPEVEADRSWRVRVDLDYPQVSVALMDSLETTVKVVRQAHTPGEWERWSNTDSPPSKHYTVKTVSGLVGEEGDTYSETYTRRFTTYSFFSKQTYRTRTLREFSGMSVDSRLHRFDNAAEMTPEAVKRVVQELATEIVLDLRVETGREAVMDTVEALSGYCVSGADG